MQNEATDLLPQGTPISQSFWKSPTIQELARSQNVQPMANVRTLFGAPGRMRKTTVSRLQLTSATDVAVRQVLGKDFEGITALQLISENR